MEERKRTIAKPGEAMVTTGKSVVLVVRHDDEREAFTSLLEDMNVTVLQAQSGREAIMMLEDRDCNFLIMDVLLSDMHAWKMLGTLKESVNLADLPTVVIMDEPTVVPLANVTPVVRPVSMPKLRKIFADLMLP